MTGWQDGDWRNEDLCKFEESNLSNKMGLQFHDLSHPGVSVSLAALFRRRQIERLHECRNPAY